MASPSLNGMKLSSSSTASSALASSSSAGHAPASSPSASPVRSGSAASMASANLPSIMSLNPPMTPAKVSSEDDNGGVSNHHARRHHHPSEGGGGGGGGQWYGNVFDPKLVTGQIIAMQGLSYLSLCFLLWLVHEMLGTDTFTLSQIFDYRAFHELPIPSSVVVVVNGAFVGSALMFVVERAKKCMDFAATVYILHLGFCWRLRGFPMSWEWWAAHGAALVVSTTLGEWLCVRRELSEIRTSDFLALPQSEASSRQYRPGGSSPLPINTTMIGGQTQTTSSMTVQLPRRAASAKIAPEDLV